MSTEENDKYKSVRITPLTRGFLIEATMLEPCSTFKLDYDWQADKKFAIEKFEDVLEFLEGMQS